MFRQHVRPPCLLSIALVIAVPVCLIYVLQLLFPDVSDTMPPSPMAPPSRGTHRLFVGVLIVLGCAMVFVMMRTLLDAAAPSEERRRTSKVRPSFIARRSATSLADEPLLPSPKLALALLQERNRSHRSRGYRHQPVPLRRRHRQSAWLTKWHQHQHQHQRDRRQWTLPRWRHRPLHLHCRPRLHHLTVARASVA